MRRQPASPYASSRLEPSDGRSSSASTPPRPGPSRGVKIVVAGLLVVVGMVAALSYAFLRLATP